MQHASLKVNKLLEVNQPVKCYVLGNQNKDATKKYLALSMRNSYVNRHLSLKHMVPGFYITGSVESIEDHG